MQSFKGSVRRRLTILLVGGMLAASCVQEQAPAIGLPTGSPSPVPATPVPTIRIIPRRVPAFNPAEQEYTTLFSTCQQEATGGAFSPAPVIPSTPDEHSLRSLAVRHGLLIGAAIGSYRLAEPAYTETARREFNLVTPENAMKWANIHPEPDSYDFRQADAIVQFALQHGMQVRGHTLVWGQALPAWVSAGEYSREEWVSILCRHIKTVVGRYQGYISAWDVVNEAIANDGTLYENHWLQVIGPEYIPMAFQWAHEADPGALLFFNEHSGEGLNRKSQAVLALVQALQAQDLPIHGVGLQMHTWLGGRFTPEALQANLERLSALGLQVQITEMDIRLQYSDAPLPVKLAQQAELYGQVFSVCLQNPACTAFVTWGVSDRYSWIPSLTGKPDAPLLFDADFQPKPAYFTLLELLAAP